MDYFIVIENKDSGKHLEKTQKAEVETIRTLIRTTATHGTYQICLFPLVHNDTKKMTL